MDCKSILKICWHLFFLYFVGECNIIQTKINFKKSHWKSKQFFKLVSWFSQFFYKGSVFCIDIFLVLQGQKLNLKNWSASKWLGLQKSSRIGSFQFYSYFFFCLATESIQDIIKYLEYKIFVFSLKKIRQKITIAVWTHEYHIYICKMNHNVCVCVWKASAKSLENIYKVSGSVYIYIPYHVCNLYS